MYIDYSSVNIALADSSAIDGLGRLRISDTDLLESLHFANTSHPLLTLSSVTGSATAVSSLANSSVRLTTTTSSSDSVTFQTKRYFRYNPGRSYMITLSGNFGLKKANVKKEWGYHDDNNGVFFRQDGTNLSVVIRTNQSGSPVDTVVNQSSWNIDKFDGTGPSGITLDTSQHNLYEIDFLWHGAGRTRFGIKVGQGIYYCHAFDGGNTSAHPFMRTPSLPIRAKITNTGTVASSTSVDVVCFAYIKESSDSLRSPYNFSASMGRTTKSVSTTLIPLISIRPAATFGGLTNRIPIIPTGFSVMGGSQNTYVALVLNSTLTGASFASVSALGLSNSFSSAEMDTAATAMSGGTIFKELYVSSSSSGLSSVSALTSAAIEALSLGLDIAGSNPDILTIAASSLAGGTNTAAQIDWEEYQ